MVSVCRSAKIDQICPNTKCISSSPQRYCPSKNMAYDIFHRNSACITCNMVSSAFYVKQPVQMCPTLADENREEETTVCTSMVDDFIHYFFQWPISLIILDVKHGLWTDDITFFSILWTWTKSNSVISKTDSFEKNYILKMKLNIHEKICYIR